MAKKQAHTVEEGAKLLVLKLEDSASKGIMRLGIDRASIKLRDSVTIRRKASGRASLPCVGYFTGEADINGQTVRISLSMVTPTHEAASALGCKLVAEAPADAARKPGAVKVRAMSFDELAAAGVLGK